MAFATGALALAALAVSVYRPSDASARARIDQLAPVIAEAANRYQIDPGLLAAIVYVTEREQNKPFRDELESVASAAFLLDEDGNLLLSKPFDFSLGLAQIKPVTALTALKVCREIGQPWELWFKHLREVPKLGREWQLGPDAAAACQPPLLPVPVNKSEVVSALMRDDDNIAFAAMILALYRWQWRTANLDWDIASRPDILATLYQIGFEKSHPHAAPRSNAFGARVAEVSRERWLRERFDGPRLAGSTRRNGVNGDARRAGLLSGTLTWVLNGRIAGYAGDVSGENHARKSACLFGSTARALPCVTLSTHTAQSAVRPQLCIDREFSSSFVFVDFGPSC